MNVTRPPLAVAAKISLPPAPLKMWVSKPPWPSTLSEPSPGSHTKVSSPSPRNAVSAPPLPSTKSLPRPPKNSSLPLPPMRLSSPLPPSTSVGFAVVNPPLAVSSRTKSSPPPASTSMVAKVPRSNVSSAVPSSPMSSWSWFGSVRADAQREAVREWGSRDAQVPSITLALTVGAAVAMGTAIDVAIAASAAAASSVFRVIPKISCPPSARAGQVFAGFGMKRYRPYATGVGGRFRTVSRGARARPGACAGSPRAPRPPPDRADRAAADR